MNIELNNTKINVTAWHTEEGTYLKLASMYGEWEHLASDRCLPISTDEDVANVMEIILETLVDMEDYPTFNHFRDMVEHGGGELTDEDQKNYDYWQDRYQEWNNITCHTAHEMMDYITKTYDV